ncbi:MAG: guanylate kinase [Candidatus Caenarcaniphilales bacterium]|nr:guanylate kinase [Candidatus Caenarcaniphilales bacterium]
MSSKGNLILLVGPSGVGKGTVLKEVFKKLNNLVFSVSVTTREKRLGEEEGINYFFRTKEEFLKLAEDNQLLEWAEFVGNYYGTPRKYVEEQIHIGKDVVLEIEVEGARQIKKNMPSALFIFMAPPSLATLQKRLKERSTESDEKVKSRIKKSEQELKEANWFDHVVINEEGKIDQTCQQVIEIIKNYRLTTNQEDKSLKK